MSINEVDTRSEQLDEGMFELQNASQNLETLVKYHGLESERVDLWDLRARIHVAEEHLKAAKQLVDRELGKDAQHQRRGDLVIAVRNEIKEKETYRGGDSTALRQQVALSAADLIVGDEHEPTDDERSFAIQIADEIASVWSQPAKSKLPSKPKLKKLGIDPEEWLTADTVAKLDVKVWDVELYESVIGPAPRRPLTEIETAQEPF